MKPFSLEAAKRGEPIVCRDGTPAKFIAYVPEARPACRVVVLAGDFVVTEAVDGRRWTDVESDTDVFMAPKKRTIWINAYWSGATVFSFGTQEEADKAATKDRLGGKAWPLEIEE